MVVLQRDHIYFGAANVVRLTLPAETSTLTHTVVRLKLTLNT